ncbi:MAG: 2-dehydropantoate 2-reductase [Oscillochloris sp.]|nr:2-dehydropantoate 2-reductase [Oscillochloris sp.]
MRYVVVGAGAIGGTLGAYMARGGEDVGMVDIAADHVAAINANGLTIRGYAETFSVPVQAFELNALPDNLECVILAVKAPATAAAMDAIAAKLAPEGMVVSAQNGLNELIISRMVGAERTIGCFINFSADYLEPGLIHFAGPGSFYIGELDGRITPRLLALQQAFSHWDGGSVRTTDNIWGYLWGKQGYGAMLFATAVSNATMADAIDRYRAVMIAICREVLAVARAEGVAPLGFDGYEPDLLGGDDPTAINESLDRLIAIRRRDQKTHSGIWRDLAIRKRRTEVDAHFGPILERAAAHGIAVPVLTRMVECIHAIEDGRLQLADANLDQLAALCGGTRYPVS